MHKINHQRSLAEQRKRRVRLTITGTSERPRLSVLRSNKNVFLQVIDDSIGKTIASVHQKAVKTAGTKTEKAQEAAKLLAVQLKKAKITKLVFDRGSYRYHGRVKAVAEAVRQAGLEM